jgi:hypothetical protein
MADIATTTATAPVSSGQSADGAGSGHKAPLDDVMLAMDVVDTLRRKERLVQRELDSGARERALKERLRKIYAAQGIEVNDAILSEGVKALQEDRFVYTPPKESLALKLARVYVSRGVWGKWVIGASLGVVLFAVAWQLLVIGPRNALPDRLRAMHAEVTALAVDTAGDAQADRLLASAERALRDGQTTAAAGMLDELETLRARLEADYSIRVVNRAGERSGVWRIPDANRGARNYYLIVEAVGPSGQTLRVPIENEETGETERVDTWGLRVSQAVFESVAADKQDDGIIQADLVGRKKPGQLEPDYRISTTGAAITDW